MANDWRKSNYQGLNCGVFISERSLCPSTTPPAKDDDDDNLNRVANYTVLRNPSAAAAALVVDRLIRQQRTHLFEFIDDPLRFPPPRLDGSVHRRIVIEIGRLARKLNHNLASRILQWLLQVARRNVQKGRVDAAERVGAPKMGIRVPLGSAKRQKTNNIKT